MTGPRDKSPMLQRLLEAVHLAEQRRRLLRRAGLAVAATLVSLCLLIVLDAARPLAEWGLCVAAVLMLATALTAAGLLLAVWRGHGRELTVRDLRALAMRVERQVDCRDATLSSAVALACTSETTAGSAALRDLAVERGESMARQLDPIALLTVMRSRWPWRVCAALVVLLLFASLWQPRLPGAAVARLLQPWADLPPYARTMVNLQLDRADATQPLLEADRVRVVARVHGPAAKDPVVLVMRTGAEQTTQRLPMAYVSNGGAASTFTAELSAGRGPLRLRAEAGGARSQWVRLQPLPVPRVVRLTAEVRPPRALNLPARLIEPGHGGLDVWPGSVVTIRVEVDVALTGGAAAWSSDDGVSLWSTDVHDRELIARQTVQTPGRLRVTAHSGEGVAMVPAVSVPIRLLSDMPMITMTADDVKGLLRIAVQDELGLERIAVMLREVDGQLQPLHQWTFPPPGPEAYAVTMRLPEALMGEGGTRVLVTAVGRRGQAPTTAAHAGWPSATEPVLSASRRLTQFEGGRGSIAGGTDAGSASSAHDAFPVVEAGEPAAWTAIDLQHRGTRGPIPAENVRMPRVPLQYREAAAAYLRGLAQVTLWENPRDAGSGAVDDE